MEPRKWEIEERHKLTDACKLLCVKLHTSRNPQPANNIDARFFEI